MRNVDAICLVLLLMKLMLVDCFSPSENTGISVLLDGCCYDD